MGEGKSSVIIPIVAAALADGKQLVRVIVPKALTVQMFDLLVARLGGLANRAIYYLPFSRTPERNYYSKVTSLQIDDLHKLVVQCIADRGILCSSTPAGRVGNPAGFPTAHTHVFTSDHATVTQACVSRRTLLSKVIQSPNERKLE